MDFKVIAIELTRDARNAAYRAGLCIGCTDPLRIGCTEPHSPGRPRCEQCHHIWSTTLPLKVILEAIPADAVYAEMLCTGPVCTRGGKANKFRVRRDDIPGAGLCEMCFGLSRGGQGKVKS